MESPSLGYAIGLNVKGKSAFAGLGPQLSENIAQWSAKKERAAKEKKAEDDKFWDKVMEAKKVAMNVRVQSDYNNSFENYKDAGSRALDAGDSRKLNDASIEFIGNQTDLKRLSDEYDKVKEQISTGEIVSGKAIQKFVGTDQPITDKDIAEMRLIGGYIYDPTTRRILSVPVKYTPSQTYLDNRQVTADELLAAQLKEDNLAKDRQKTVDEKIKTKTADAEKAKGKKLTKAEKAAIKAEAEKEVPAPELLVTSGVYKSKAVPGYDQNVYNIQTPTKQIYSTIVDEILTNPEAVDGALMEWEKSSNQSLYDKIEQIKKDYATNNNGAAIDEEGAAIILAKEHYMGDKLFNSWLQKNSKAIQMSRKPVGGGRVSSSGSKTDEVEGVSDITYQAHWSNKGFAKQKTGWVGKAGELYEMKKKGEIYGDVIAGYGPTVEFTGGPSGEVYSIAGLGNINPVSLYYDIDTGKFRLSYNTTITSSGLTIPADQKDAELTKEQLNQVRGALATNMQKKIAAFDAALANDGYPTTLQAAGGGAPAGSTGGGFSWGTMSPKK